jgi:hypothetical protein
MKKVSFVIDHKLVLILVDVFLKPLGRDNAVSQKGCHMCRPFVFVEATNSCDNSRPVSRPFAHEIWPTADYVWYGVFRSFPILNEEIVLPKLFNPSCEAFYWVAYDYEIFQTLVIGVDRCSMPIVDVDSLGLQSILDG